MTVQEYLDHLAERLLADAVDGTMPKEIQHQVQEVLDRLQTEVDSYGHVQTRLPSAVLLMPWDEFKARVDRYLKAH